MTTVTGAAGNTRALAIVPAAINERDLLPDLIEGADYLSELLTDKGFNGK